MCSKLDIAESICSSLLAAYDFGASAKQLEAIYDAEQKELNDIHTIDRRNNIIEEQKMAITGENWTEFLGQDKCGLG